MKNFSFILLALSILLFVLVKLPNLSVRLSDTNPYFYIGYKLLHQQLLYKEIFFANLPLFPYISSIYYLMTLGDIKMFYATALLEVMVINFLIYFVVYTKTKNYIISAISSLLYMFSSTVLVTSDHQAGLFTASIFILLSYIFLEKKKFLISGLFASLSLLTKAYFLPIIVSFAIYLFIRKEYKHFFRFLAGFIFLTALILLPFLIFARKEFIASLLFSMTREGGVKQDIIWSFIRNDFILFFVLIFNLLNFKKNSLFALISLLSIVFFFFYQGAYSIYLNFLIPFLVISFYNLSNFLAQKKHFLKIAFPIIVIFATVTNIVIYIYFFNLGRIENINSIVELIKKEDPKYLYGTAHITPALAYISKRPLLDNAISTHLSLFRNKFLDGKKLTEKAIAEKTIIVAYGTFNNKLNIDNIAQDEIFDKDLLKKYCKRLASFPIYAGNAANRIYLLKCY